MIYNYQNYYYNNHWPFGQENVVYKHDGHVIIAGRRYGAEEHGGSCRVRVFTAAVEFL